MIKNFNNKISVILKIVLLALIITSCSVMNPHKRIDSHPDGFDNYTIPNGISYADDLIEHYQKGMGNQAKLNSYTGLIMVPLSVATLNLGIKGNHVNAVTNLTSAGVATYGLSTWLSNSTKSLIYADGIKALNCVKQSIIPFLINSVEKKDILGNLDELSRLISDVNDQIFYLNTELSIYKSDANHDAKLVKNIELTNAHIEKYVSDSQITLKNGYSLIHNLNNSGKVLVVTIDQIDGEVNRLLSTNSPSISALPGLINGLAPVADLFKQVPDPTNTIQSIKETSVKTKLFTHSDKAKKVDNKALLNLRNHVYNIYQNLKIFNRLINIKVAVFEDSINKVDLKSCGINEADIVKPLRALPSNRISINTGEIKTVMISGGSEKYALTVTNEISDLTVTQPIPFGEVVKLSLSKEMTESKSTEILIKDTTGKTILIEVIINPETNPNNINPNQETEDVTEKTSNNFTQSLSVETTRLIQTALNICNDKENLPINIDGIFGSITNNSAKECLGIKNTITQLNVEDLIKTFLDGGLPIEGPQTEFEISTTVDDLEILYNQLGLDSFDIKSVQPQDLFTKELRLKIKEFQENHDSNEKDAAKKIGISGLYTQKFPLK